MVHGRIVIDTARCKGCELCATFCPQHVIHMASWFNAKGYRPAELVDPAGDCTGCAVCAIVCPDVAIEVYREQEPRTTLGRSEGAASPSRPPQSVRGFALPPTHPTARKPKQE